MLLSFMIDAGKNVEKYINDKSQLNDFYLRQTEKGGANECLKFQD